MDATTESTRTIIADVDCTGILRDRQGEANARLNDELVEALENMVGCIDETGQLAAMYFDHARALLKRAKGDR